MANNRWYPNKNQVKDDATHRAFKQVLDQHYALVDRLNAMETKSSTTSATQPAGNGPADTKLLGLHVVPVDTQTLANGATLKFNKANGNFEFS